jgi:hypothetical protein
MVYNTSYIKVNKYYLNNPITITNHQVKDQRNHHHQIVYNVNYKHYKTNSNNSKATLDGLKLRI